MKDALLEHIDRIKTQRPAAKTALEAYRELVVLMTEADSPMGSIHVDDRLGDIKAEEGFPLFSRADLPLDLESSSRLLKKFIAHFASMNRDDQQGMKKALKVMNSDPGWAGKLFRAILKEDESDQEDIAGSVDLNSATLAFLGTEAMKPALQSLRHAIADSIPREKWDVGYCPLCGSEPNMAFFTKTGERHLHCGFCGEEWRFARIKCPFCNSEDQESLGYFEAEEEEGFKVYFCRECSRYIKTVDKRVFEEVAPLELESLATLHLDLLAHEQGFK